MPGRVHSASGGLRGMSLKSISLSGIAAKRASRVLASSLSGVLGARVNLTVFPVVVSFIGFSLSGGDEADCVATHGVNVAESIAWPYRMKPLARPLSFIERTDCVRVVRFGCGSGHHANAAMVRAQHSNPHWKQCVSPSNGSGLPGENMAILVLDDYPPDEQCFARVQGGSTLRWLSPTDRRMSPFETPLRRRGCSWWGQRSSVTEAGGPVNSRAMRAAPVLV